MAARKLQAEVDRVFKKIHDGVELFDETYEKACSSEFESQKDKLEADLKSQIKKLQKLRDQVKQWQGSNDFRDKSKLLEHRRLIESKMEAFKEFEKHAKTKAYSKEGLASSARSKGKTSPEKTAKLEWLAECIERLETQLTSMEEEMETLSSRRRKRSAVAEEIETLEEYIERHKFQVTQLKKTIEALEYDRITLELIEEIEEVVEYHIDSYNDPDYYYDEFMFENLHLDDDGFVATSEEPSQISSLAQYSAKGSAVSTSSKSKKKTSSKKKDSSKKGSNKSSLDAVADIGRGTTGRKNSAKGAKGAKGSTKGSTKGASSRKLVDMGSGTKKSTGPTPVAPANVAKPPPLAYSNVAAKNVHKPQPSAAAGATAAGPPGIDARPAQSLTSLAPTPLSRPPHQQDPTHPPGLPPGLPPAQGMGPVGQQARGSQRSQQQPRSASDGPPGMAPGMAQAHRPRSTAAHQQLSSSAAAAAGTSMPPSSLKELAQATLTARSEGNATKRGKRKAHLEAMLERSFLALPETVERQVVRQPVNPAVTPAYYPKSVHPALAAPATFEKLESDSLFFAFYHQQGTYQQALAARQLKAQAWRFHKKYRTWFQRLEEPLKIDHSSEYGTYVYFDESGWVKRRKTAFHFRYRYLENE